MNKHEILQKIATRLRIHSLKMTTEAGSGHPSTCLSMAEITSCLFFDEMQFNIHDAHDWANDEFVLSKGHAAPILWAVYAEAGILPQEKLMDLRKITSPLEGHPTPRMEWVKGATGSLGQGLAVAVGIALAQKIARVPRRTYVVMGDGEIAEGAVWEAANAASRYHLENLCAVVDINRLGQSDETMHGHDLDVYARKFSAFDWHAIKIDGHDIDQILSGFEEAKKVSKPSVLLCKTVKGKGISFVEDKNGWHGKPLKEDDLQKALQELGPMPEVDSAKYVRVPGSVDAPVFNDRADFPRNAYKEKTATRRAYGNALVNLARINPRVVSLDGDVKNSTYAEDFFDAFPERAFQLHIAEQNMVGIGIGLSAKGYMPFIATFAAFLSRAHDQVRMAAYSFSNLKLVGSHVGVSIGQDGPSQMGLEDLAIFRPIPGCLILYPSDAFSTEACVEAMAEYDGLSYLRTTRPGTPLLYSIDEKFHVGGSKVLRSSEDDAAVVIAAGITLHEALKAYEELKDEGISVRVIDAYSIQPLDKEAIAQGVKDAGGRAVVVEDHFEHGGLCDAVAAALDGGYQIKRLAVKELPRSGQPDELLEKYGIGAVQIVRTVKEFVSD